jgi:hypothetical protein
MSTAVHTAMSTVSKPKTKKQNKNKKASVKVTVRSTTGAKPKRRRRGRASVGARAQRAVGLNYISTDGINASRVVTNRSVIEDTFQVRREKIANISGTSAFTLAQALYINPGNTVLFPIFSQIAATYEEYRINKCVFSFETDAYTATNGTASAGKVIMATDFDPSDAVFTNDTQMENYCGSVKGPPYVENMIHDVMGAGRSRRRGARGDFSLNNYFVYSSANSSAPSGEVSKFYDAGLFQLATSGNAVTTEIGELYVTYSFTMIRPKQQTPLGQNLISAHYTSVPVTATTWFGTGAATAKLAGSNITLTFGATTIAVPAVGRYFLAVSGTATTSITGAYFTAGTGCTIVSGQGTGGNVTNAGGGAGTGNYVFAVTFDVTAAGGILNLPAPTIVGTAVADLWISQISSGLTTERKAIGRLEELFRRVSLIEQRGSQSCSSTVVTPFEDDFEESKLDQSVHLSRDVVRKLLGADDSGLIHVGPPKSVSHALRPI